MSVSNPRGTHNEAMGPSLKLAPKAEAAGVFFQSPAVRAASFCVLVLGPRRRRRYGARGQTGPQGKGRGVASFGGRCLELFHTLCFGTSLHYLFAKQFKLQQLSLKRVRVRELRHFSGAAKQE